MRSRMVRWLSLFRFRLISPEGLIVAAGIAAIPFLVLNLAGAREYTSIICGTLPDPDVSPASAAALGCAYAAAYLAFVFAASPLMLAAGIMALLLLRPSPSRRTDDSAKPTNPK